MKKLSLFVFVIFVIACNFVSGAAEDRLQLIVGRKEVAAEQKRKSLSELEAMQREIRQEIKAVRKERLIENQGWEMEIQEIEAMRQKLEVVRRERLIERQAREGAQQDIQVMHKELAKIRQGWDVQKKKSGW